MVNTIDAGHYVRLNVLHISQSQSLPESFGRTARRKEKLADCKAKVAWRVVSAFGSERWQCLFSSGSRTKKKRARKKKLSINLAHKRAPALLVMWAAIRCSLRTCAFLATAGERTNCFGWQGFDIASNRARQGSS
ncbi:hypothetical protein FA10DRAFT_43875 [Acaromyces ingoldii]|uniref:Uncharacterized protein n=1 Tax=Acaromyces ingoldii TaxID=215250 RepID=A0A316YZZ3_9BASI|nr:hypothetical protein FA10DRAFT_43875 [Acaromyces ingoldii]PWN94238.1 hypothetical protein FA10DRAFT_43875 [Acaromyces ingoldii]